MGEIDLYITTANYTGVIWVFHEIWFGIKDYLEHLTAVAAKYYPLQWIGDLTHWGQDNMAAIF